MTRPDCTCHRSRWNRPGGRGAGAPAIPGCQTGGVSQRIRTAVRVEGVVQGVGFRPFVYSLATSLGLGGLVGNDVDVVFAEVEGPPAVVERFLFSLAREAPPLARIERITTMTMRPRGTASFSIAPSEPGRQRRAPGRADTATLPDCPAGLPAPPDPRVWHPAHPLPN